MKIKIKNGHNRVILNSGISNSIIALCFGGLILYPKVQLLQISILDYFIKFLY